LEVAQLEQNPSVVRILLKDSLILDGGPIVSLLLDVLLGSGEYPFSVDRHDYGCSLGVRPNVHPE
jgi:hypothetical protein